MNTEQPEFELAWQNAENTLADQFVMTATINGVERWEKIFDIVPKATDTLDERRFVILSKMNEQPPYTLPLLRSILNTLCGEGGYTLYLNADKYLLTIKLALSNEKNYAAIVDLLDRILPANLAREISMYNTHGILGNYTHGQLAQFTHDELRKDVLV